MTEEEKKEANKLYSEAPKDTVFTEGALKTWREAIRQSNEGKKFAVVETGDHATIWGRDYEHPSVEDFQSLALVVSKSIGQQEETHDSFISRFKWAMKAIYDAVAAASDKP